MSVYNISSLPLELLTTICSHLSRPDQRTTRLVSHLLNTATQATLFQIIFLKLDLRSFQRLQEIAQHEYLSKHVRAICFDPRQLQLRQPARDVDFSYWRNHIAGTGMGVSKNEPDENFLSLCGPMALNGYFLQYRKFIEDFNLLVRHGKWADMLFDSVQSFPGLSQIYYTEGTYHDPRWLVTDLDDGLERIRPNRSIANEILAVPSLPSSYDTGLWTLLELISGTDSASKINRISGLDAESDIREGSQPKCKGILGKFPNLYDLALTFDNTNASSLEDYAALPSVIATATNLQSLCLRIRYRRDPDNRRFHRRSLYMRDLIQCQWPHLQRLELYGMIIEEGDLREFIREHASTLRCLKLSHVELRLTIASHRYDRENWIRVLSSLIHSTGLECVIFDSITPCISPVGSANMVNDWYAAGVQAQFMHKYPRSEYFVKVFRDGEYKEDLGEDDESEDDEAANDLDDKMESGGLQDVVVSDWISCDRHGHFNSELEAVTLPFLHSVER